MARSKKTPCAIERGLTRLARVRQSDGDRLQNEWVVFWGALIFLGPVWVCEFQEGGIICLIESLEGSADESPAGQIAVFEHLCSIGVGQGLQLIRKIRIWDGPIRIHLRDERLPEVRGGFVGHFEE